MFKIVKLNSKNLDAACKLADKIFSYDKQFIPSQAFRSSLDKKLFQKYNQLPGWGCESLEYWLAVDTKTNEVVGSTGLYTKKKDPADLCWLGWYCVSPDYRGQGVGSALLDFTIDQVRKKINTDYVFLLQLLHMKLRLNNFMKKKDLKLLVKMEKMRKYFTENCNYNDYYHKKITFTLQK